LAIATGRPTIVAWQWPGGTSTLAACVATAGQRRGHCRRTGTYVGNFLRVKHLLVLARPKLAES
jgi:hypothetical protein